MIRPALGVPRETLPWEARVAATPAAVHALRRQGTPVLVEQEAGAASGFSDEDYLRAGAEIAPTAEELYDRCRWIWKVLRPDGHELTLIRPDHTLLCLLHPRPDRPLPCRAVALEAWERDGIRPVLAAMSAIAGRLALLHAAQALQHPAGCGLLPGGTPGVEPARLLILGAGTAGRSAAALGLALGADVTLLDPRLSALTAAHAPGLRTLLYSPAALERALAAAHLVVAAPRGHEAPLAGRGHLALMPQGAVIADLAVDATPAFSTTPITAPGHPQDVDGILHIGIPNLAGLVPRTSSAAFSAAALERVLAEIGAEIADPARA